MKRKTAYTLLILFFILALSSYSGYLYVKNRRLPTTKSSTVSPTDSLPSENTQPEITANTPAPFSAVPAVPDPACFTYEELADGTLRITGYDEEKNTQNPYQVIIPSMINGKPVSTLGTQSIATRRILELIVSDGITTLENSIIASAYDKRLVTLPDSAVNIDPKAFCHSEYDYTLPVVISCANESSYAYQYATENNFACHLENPVDRENAFLRDYAVGPCTSLPYFTHIREKGDVYDYVVVEYLDIAEGLQLYKDSRYFSSSYIWNRNEYAVLVLDKESDAIIQCIDSSSSFNPELISLRDVPDAYIDSLLHIADYNFDGHTDLCLFLGNYGTGAISTYAVLLFDADQGIYKKCSFYMDNISLRPDKQCIDSGTRGSAMWHYIDRYQYIDGTLTRVARLNMYDIHEDDARGTGVRDERLVDGEWQVYREENIYLEDDFSDEAYQKAYEQLRYLYVDDGYWDI